MLHNPVWGALCSSYPELFFSLFLRVGQRILLKGLACSPGFGVLSLIEQEERCLLLHNVKQSFGMSLKTQMQQSRRYIFITFSFLSFFRSFHRKSSQFHVSVSSITRPAFRCAMPFDHTFSSKPLLYDDSF